MNVPDNNDNNNDNDNNNNNNPFWQSQSQSQLQSQSAVEPPTIEPMANSSTASRATTMNDTAFASESALLRLMLPWGSNDHDHDHGDHPIMDEAGERTSKASSSSSVTVDVDVEEQDQGRHQVATAAATAATPNAEAYTTLASVTESVASTSFAGSPIPVAEINYMSHPMLENNESSSPYTLKDSDQDNDNDNDNDNGNNVEPTLARAASKKHPKEDLEDLDGRQRQARKAKHVQNAAMVAQDVLEAADLIQEVDERDIVLDDQETLRRLEEHDAFYRAAIRHPSVSQFASLDPDHGHGIDGTAINHESSDESSLEEENAGLASTENRNEDETRQTFMKTESESKQSCAQEQQRQQQRPSIQEDVLAAAQFIQEIDEREIWQEQQHRARQDDIDPVVDMHYNDNAKHYYHDHGIQAMLIARNAAVATASAACQPDVIDLLDDADADDDDNNDANNNKQKATSFSAIQQYPSPLEATMRKRLKSSDFSYPAASSLYPPFLLTVPEENANPPTAAQPSGAVTSFHKRKRSNLPEWMQQAAASVATSADRTSPDRDHLAPAPYQRHGSNNNNNIRISSKLPTSIQKDLRHVSEDHVYLPMDGFRPTWDALLPSATPKPPPLTAVAPVRTGRRRYYQLSLLNVNEFTITGLSPSMGRMPTSIAGLRVPIKQISRQSGKEAVFDRDLTDDNNNPERATATVVTTTTTITAEGGTSAPGKWRIPLSAYHALLAYLRSDLYTRVDGIPELQLNIASLERARQEKGYPDASQLIQQYELLPGLAHALAPFQRGGVDFVTSKGGRALIADDMGLGKTIQGIASMAVYYRDWPVLVLCPSSARYHWENEFRNWLGRKSPVNVTDAAVALGDEKEGKQSSIQHESRGAQGMLLDNSQIHVLNSSKGDILPTKRTKVLICSYGLAPALVESRKLYPGLFRCAIVDESHMLKNRAAKRTSALVPVLRATHRCVLLSGTPAMARPMELWPQLEILGTEQHGWWSSEEEFMEKYVRNGGPKERAELHVMLTGTVMIRRLKSDILKTMPPKIREKAEIHVLDRERKTQFQDLLMQLREGKGALGLIARKQHAERSLKQQGGELNMDDSDMYSSSHMNSNEDALSSSADQKALDDVQKAVEAEIETTWQQGLIRIQETLANNGAVVSLSQEKQIELRLEMEGNLRQDLDNLYRERFEQLSEQFATSSQSGTETIQVNQEVEDKRRTTLLSRLYALTGQVKIGPVVDMLRRWLADPTKGKVCIFAHHLSVLDLISRQAGLSNREDSTTKFIRIDGATSPKFRQQQINSFQTDPTVRVALLGITAAGVAVTLTASSNVWFTELFWTPALMIQAEDRCHRIGQQAQVRVLYFVAKGTLDDVLWRLIEKKFQDLGEFVEGKEKLKLVVDKVYNGIHELHSIFVNEDDMSGGESDGFDELGLGDDNDLQLGDDIFRDIEELGKEECKMVKDAADAMEDENELSDPLLEIDKKPAAVRSSTEPVDGSRRSDDGYAEEALGRTEDVAIPLSDDDGDDDDDKEYRNVAQGDARVQSTEAVVFQQQDWIASTDPESLVNARLYKVLIPGPAIEFGLLVHRGRLIVSRTDRETRKPSVGDILVSFAGHPLPIVPGTQEVLPAMRSALQRGSVEAMFVEDPVFAEFVKVHIETRKRERATRRRAEQEALSQKPLDASEVIDLIDD